MQKKFKFVNTPDSKDKKTDLVILELLLEHDPELGHGVLLPEGRHLTQELVRLVRPLPAVGRPTLVGVHVLHVTHQHLVDRVIPDEVIKCV